MANPIGPPRRAARRCLRLIAAAFAMAVPALVQAGVSVLGGGSYVSGVDGSSTPYYLLKLDDGPRVTYAQWMPAAGAQPAPALLYFEPYPGIGWSDDPVDQFWYRRGPGFYPDQYGPDYVAGQSGEVSYQSETPQQIAAADAEPMLRNQVSVLIVFGRFFRSSLVDQIRDVGNGLAFLQGNAAVDARHIGVLSGSWGGMAALYGAAGAAQAPAAVALNSPISDAGQYLDYIAAVPGAAKLRVQAQSDTYTRRMRQAIAAWPGGQAALSHAYLATRFRSALMVTHDTWDTAVPVEETYDLLGKLANVDHRAYFQTHATPIDWNTYPIAHTQAVESFGEDSSRPWEYAFLLRRLRPQASANVLAYDAPLFLALSLHLKARRDAGEDDSVWANPVYTDFCSGGLLAYDRTGALPVGTTAQLLATVMSQLWNLPRSSAAVCSGFAGAGSPFVP